MEKKVFLIVMLCFVLCGCQGTKQDETVSLGGDGSYIGTTERTYPKYEEFYQMAYDVAYDAYAKIIVDNMITDSEIEYVYDLVDALYIPNAYCPYSTEQMNEINAMVGKLVLNNKMYCSDEDYEKYLEAEAAKEDGYIFEYTDSSGEIKQFVHFGRLKDLVGAGDEFGIYVVENTIRIIQPETETELDVALDEFVDYSPKLETIVLSPNLLYLNKVVSCSDIKCIIIPNSVEDVFTCMSDCHDLKEVIFEEESCKVGRLEYCFENCWSLEKVVLNTQITYLHENLFDDCPNVILWVPEGSYAEQYASEHKIEYVVFSGEYKGEHTDIIYKTPTLEDYIHFEPSSKWSELNGYEYAVQVDDTLYVPGITASEFISLLDTSSIEYTYEYNAGTLVTKGEKVDICVYRDNREWFTAQIYNVWSETKELAELPVVKVIPTEEAVEFCYFIDGRSYEDILQMTYSDIQKLANEKFSGILKETAIEAKGKNAINMTINLGMRFMVGEEHTYSDSTNAYIFTVDKNDGMVFKYEQGKVSGTKILQHTPPAPEPITSFSELTDEELKLLKEKAEDIWDYYGNWDIELFAAYLVQEQDAVGYYGVLTMRQRSGGVYAVTKLKNVGKKKDGTLAYSDSDKYYTGKEGMSYEEYLEERTKDWIILDAILYFENQ